MKSGRYGLNGVRRAGAENVSAHLDVAPQVKSVEIEKLLASQLPPLKIAGARALLRESLAQAGATLVVLDDDPTGTQTVHGVTVLLQWSPDILRDLLASKPTAFFLSTNSRALGQAKAAALNRQIGRLLRKAAGQTGRQLLIASRSDSTLRGHYPHETDALAEGLGVQFDGQIIAPAFFDGGRYTVGDVHWVEQQGIATPVGETEFARDPSFGFVNSDLGRWVEEKTRGRYRAENVVSVSLKEIRTGGPGKVAEKLLGVKDGGPVVVNAAADEDLEVFALGVAEAEKQGRRFLYRCAASLVKVRAGIDNHPLLTAEALQLNGRPGLVVAGSYVEKTSRQLTRLLATSGVCGVEIPVDNLLDPQRRDQEIHRVTGLAEKAVAEGTTPVVFTSRKRIACPGSEFLQAGEVVMAGLCQVVCNFAKPLGFVLAKGGITSHEVARAGLGIVRAEVMGQIHKGIPVWRTGPETRWPGIPYVIFPGNVGNEETLAHVVGMLKPNRESGASVEPSPNVRRRSQNQRRDYD